MLLTKFHGSTNIEENEYGYKKGVIPFIDYILEDKSHYPKVSSIINEKTGKPYKDRDNDFLLGRSGGVLMNIDFIFVDVYKFSPQAIFFEKHGKYTLHKPKSKEWRLFWKEETKRRRVGVQAKCRLNVKDITKYYDPKTTEEDKKALLNYVRITGDHYTYLNYGRIERTPSVEERIELNKRGYDKVETVAGFPRFWDGDYWNFKIDEYISDNRLHLTKAKARRKGFSYKRGNQAANTINLNKAVTVLLMAYDIRYLTDIEATGDMAKKNLNWFEDHTYWHRGFLSEKKEEIVLGYKKSKGGNKAYGFLSKMLCYATARNESVAIGKKAIEIDIEEAGKCPNLEDVLDVTMSNMESGQIQIGTMRIYGTGGTKGSNWEHFERCFNNPKKYGMLQMENVWDKDARHRVCGFFFPNIWNMEPYVYDGNSMLFSAYAEDMKDKRIAKKEKSTREYTMYAAQRANTPAEAFINTNENMFMSPELNIHVDNLKNDNAYKFYNDGWYINDVNGVKFMRKEECIDRGIFRTDRVPFHDYIMDIPHDDKTDVHGCIREYYAPFMIDNKIPDDLYFISVDPYRVDKTKDEITSKHSLYSFQVWIKNHPKLPYNGKRLVAEYCGRLDTMEENDNLLLMACRRWNAKALIEAGTGETISNFRKWNCLELLKRDPTWFMNRSLAQSSTPPIGIVIGDSDRKLDGLSMFKDFMYEKIEFNEDGTYNTRMNYMYSVSLALELQRFSSTGNFDRISSSIVAMYEFKKDDILKREVTLNKGSSKHTESRWSKRNKTDIKSRFKRKVRIR